MLRPSLASKLIPARADPNSILGHRGAPCPLDVNNSFAHQPRGAPHAERPAVLPAGVSAVRRTFALHFHSGVFPVPIC
eukprot:scaffold5560_cov444-Prasinococcus_capsulatus_cf.AAC.9